MVFDQHRHWGLKVRTHVLSLLLLIHVVIVQGVCPDGYSGDNCDIRSIDVTYYYDYADTAELSCDTGSTSCNLRKAIEVAEDGVKTQITVTEDYKLASALVVNSGQDVEIVGVGNPTMDLHDYTTFMSVASGAEVLVSGVRVIDGVSTNDGALFSNLGTLTLIDVTMVNGVATRHGGAIANLEGGSVTALRCSFEENSASGGDGGAIHSELSTELTLTNCTFSDNRAPTGSGGALQTEGTLGVSGCTFRGNEAKYLGGAVDATGTTDIETSTFTTNKLLLSADDNDFATAASGGGALAFGDGTVSIAQLNQCEFTLNESPTYGGAIYANGEMTLSSCSVSSNTAALSGGGLWISTQATVHMASTTFADNSAPSGPAMFSNAVTERLVVVDCETLTTENTAGSVAGCDDVSVCSDYGECETNSDSIGIFCTCPDNMRLVNTVDCVYGPNPPSYFSAPAVNKNDVVLTWVDVSGNDLEVLNYKLTMQDDGGDPTDTILSPNDVSMTNDLDRSYTLANLLMGHNYVLQLSTLYAEYEDEGYSSASSSLSVTTLRPLCDIVPESINITITKPSIGQAEVYIFNPGTADLEYEITELTSGPSTPGASHASHADILAAIEAISFSSTEGIVPSSLYEPVRVTFDSGSLAPLEYSLLAIVSTNTVEGGATVQLPFDLRVDSRPDATLSTASGGGLTEAIVDQTATFEIVSRDADGMAVTSGEAVFTVTLTHVLVNDEGGYEETTEAPFAGIVSFLPTTGNYSVSYKVDHAGVYRMDVLMASESGSPAISGSPFYVTAMCGVGSYQDLWRDCDTQPNNDFEEELCLTMGLGELSPYCFPCPDNAACPYEGMTVYEIECDVDYYRLSTDSVVCNECLNVEDQSGCDESVEVCHVCLGGAESECLEGYYSTLCSKCEDGYLRDHGFECVECDEGSLLIWRIARAALIVLVVVGLVSWMVARADGVLGPHLIVLKIGISYLQALSLIRYIDVDWPTWVSQWLWGAEIVSTVSMRFLMIDCIVEGDEKYFQRVEATLLLPLACIALPVVIAVIVALLLKFVRGWMWWDHRFHRLQEFSVMSVFIMLFVVYPTVANEIFSMFACKKIEGKNYMLYSLDVECYGDTHVEKLYTIAAPGLVLYVIGIPLVIFGIIHRNRDNLNRVMRVMGFFVSGYERPYCFWECWILFRKAAMSAVIMAFSIWGPSIQGLGLLGLLYVALALHSSYKPFIAYQDSELFDQLELLSLIVSYSTVFFALVRMDDGTADSTQDVLEMLVGCLNIMALSYFIFQCVRVGYTAAVKKLAGRDPVSAAGEIVTSMSSFRSPKRPGRASSSTQYAKLQSDSGMGVAVLQEPDSSNDV